MTGKFDMNIDSRTLFEIAERLKKVNMELDASVNEMSRALKQSGDFLAGEQYEKAQQKTQECISETRCTIRKIESVSRYIAELDMILDDYNRCEYKG